MSARKIEIHSSDWPKYLMAFGVVVLIAFLCRNKATVDSYNPGEIWTEEDYVLSKDIEIKNAVSADRILSIVGGADLSINGEIDKILNSINTESPAKQKLIDLKGQIGRFYGKGIYGNKFGEINSGNSVFLATNNTVNQKSLNSDFYSQSQVQTELKNWTRDNLPGLQAQVDNIINQHVTPNLQVNTSLSEELKKQAVETTIKPKGEIIIKNGEVIDIDDLALIQESKKTALGFSFDSFSFSSFLGYLLLILLIIGALLLYIQNNHPNVFDRFSNLAFVMMFPCLISLLIYFLESTSDEHYISYLIPFCIVPIIVKNFFGERLALFVHIVVVLIASFISRLDYEFTFIQILAGIVTLLFVSETRYWNKFFNAILIIFATYTLGFLGLSLIHAETFMSIDWKPFMFFGFGSVLTLLAYPFIPLIEKLFGFTSSITLAELTDMNNPLIKELSINAQGTLQHSLQVSNLSEAATEKIGGNSLLVKAAALYHDIGKLHDPEAFIENNKGHNPHDRLSNFESASKIIDHVTKGVEMAKKAKLPQVLIDFITTHHGTTRVEYFYRNQLNAEPDKEFDESLFRYPGPKPQTKEQTILMIADSLEAASKSLKSPTGKDIDELVDNIVNYKIKEGQLDESQLNFHELEQCTEVFKSLLRSINHVRVEYPDEVKA